MKKQFTIVMILVAVLLVSVDAIAQKGSGNKEGVARGVLPPIVSMSGTILDIHIGPCVDATAGNDPIGMHFIVQTSDGIEINLHLGPARVVDTLVALLSPGQTISFEAFTTPDLSADTFIAKTVSWESGFIEFRDDALRPFWAK